MFYDLNVPWTPDEAGLQRTIAFLDERTFESLTLKRNFSHFAVGYNVLALSHTFSGKLPADLVHIKSRSTVLLDCREG